MYVVIRDHILEGDSLEDLAACLLRWMPPLVPWMLDLQNEVKEQAGEYGSEGQALLAVIKGDREKYKIDYISNNQGKPGITADFPWFYFNMSKIKKLQTSSAAYFCVAGAVGIEPTTNGFGDRYSTS